MKFNIYDYADNPLAIDTGNKEINSITVTVLSGDETINILYKDGKMV